MFKKIDRQKTLNLGASLISYQYSIKKMDRRKTWSLKTVTNRSIVQDEKMTSKNFEFHDHL